MTKKKSSARDEEEDLTKDMEDPVPEPNIQEVHFPKDKEKAKKDPDLQPLKGATMMDVEEEDQEAKVEWTFLLCV